MATGGHSRAATAFAAIPAGRFLMGSDEGQDDERPVHHVEIDAFELAVYPVTQADYAEFLRATNHDPPFGWPSSIVDTDLPATGVSWFDAQAYCAWSSAGAGGDRDRPVRLPTEAEWERAARGGLERARYPGGDDIPAWIPNGGRGPLPGPWPVTRGEPNAFGVYGICANIHEWCADWHDAAYYAASPARNPRGPASGVRRASRGGAWRHAVTVSRCAQRSRIHPSFRYTDYGFRVAR
jgi:formylglycine-generating enzyme required for sulfatase activity